MSKVISRSASLVSLLVLAACAAPPEPPPPDDVGVVRVPLELENGMPWVEARIGGRTVRLLVDLGGFDAVALVPEVLKELPVTWTGRTRSTFTAMGESAVAREYEIHDFEVGGIVFREVRGYEDLLQGSPRGIARDGYIGLGILRRFRIVIDYAVRELVLIWPDAAPPEPYDVENWATLDFAPGSDGVMTRATVDGTPRLLVWDTGASHCVLKAGLEGGAPVRTRGGQPFVTANSFEVGGVEAGPMEFALLGFKEPRADGFVGYSFFAKHAVYVDFRKRSIAVRP